MYRVLLCLISLTIVAKQAEPLKDPYQPIRYTAAFYQDDLWVTYHEALHASGCADNLLVNHSIDDPNVKLDHTMVQHELKLYQDACMQRLQRARTTALAEPALYACLEMGLMAVGAAVLMKFLGKESAGGSFAAFTALFDSLRLMRGVIQSGCNLVSRPDNPLEQYENRFACNKCFIPRALWPKIMRELISARQNDFSREVHTGFLEFALGFTTYRPLPSLQASAASLHEVKKIIAERIRSFFVAYGYEQFCPDVYAIVLNVTKFIDQVADPSAQAMPRYIYLYGPGGIGKTYFVAQLASWIEELLPGAVNFEQVVINSSQELEGTVDRPGALLKVLHNQLRQQRRGSIVVFDEADLNDPSLIAAAKRTFNVDQSAISTAYLGQGPEGAGIELERRPMLIFVANNSTIADAALASRFDTVHFPTPSKSALLAYAISILHTSEAVQQSAKIIDTEEVSAWIETLTQQQLNYRFIAGAVEIAFLLDNILSF